MKCCLDTETFYSDTMQLTNLKHSQKQNHESWSRTTYQHHL